DEDVDLLHAVVLRLARSRLGGELRGVGRRLARALHADRAARGLRDDGAGDVGDRDDRVVEGRLDVGLAHGDVLLVLLARLADRGLGSCHVSLPPRGLAAGLLLAGDRLLLALAGARVRLGALTAHGQATTVADALVRADLDLATDVG